MRTITINGLKIEIPDGMQLIVPGDEGKSARLLPAAAAAPTEAARIEQAIASIPRSRHYSVRREMKNSISYAVRQKIKELAKPMTAIDMQNYFPEVKPSNVTAILKNAVALGHLTATTAGNSTYYTWKETPK